MLYCYNVIFILYAGVSVCVMPHEKKRNKKGVFCFVSTVQRDLFIFVTVVTRYCARHESGIRTLISQSVVSRGSPRALSVIRFSSDRLFFFPFAKATSVSISYHVILG